MPRTEIDLPQAVEHLSVLDEDGELDKDLLPDLSDASLLEFHRLLLPARRCGERLLQLQRQGRIGTFVPVKGKEASQVGAVSAPDETGGSSLPNRETAAAVWRGISLTGLLPYNAGYNEGAAIPDEMHDFPIAVPVASQISHAVESLEKEVDCSRAPRAAAAVAARQSAGDCRPNLSPR